MSSWLLRVCAFITTFFHSISPLSLLLPFLLYLLIVAQAPAGRDVGARDVIMVVTAYVHLPPPSPLSFRLWLYLLVVTQAPAGRGAGARDVGSISVPVPVRSMSVGCDATGRRNICFTAQGQSESNATAISLFPSLVACLLTG